MKFEDIKGPVYISGPITGVEHGNKQAFLDMEKQLTDNDIPSVNPRRHQIPEGTLEEDIWTVMMRKAIIDLMWCESIVFLENWTQSMGAIIEYKLAHNLKIARYDHNFNIL